MANCIRCSKRLTKANTGAWQYGSPIRCVVCTRALLASGPVQLLNVNPPASAAAG